jgi:hypothetical protein
MNKAFLFVLLMLPASLVTLMPLGGCTIHKNATDFNKSTDPVYDTAERIRAMPACEAVVVERGPCYIRLRTANGSSFLIGSPAAGKDVVQFLYLLKDGWIYKFPETFQKYEEQRARTGKEK